MNSLVLKVSPKQAYDKERKRLACAAWKVWSLHVRSKGSINGSNRCYTCNKLFPISKLNAGHYHHTHSKKKGKRTLDIDYNPKNIKPQCQGCNGKWGHGKPRIFIENLVKEYGPSVVGELYQANNNRQQLTNEQLKEIIEKYTIKILRT